MEQATILPLVEALFRILLGLRFLSSGVSNVRRWPHATQTAKLVFPRGAYFFGLVATALMVLGGGGLALGFQTPISALMLIVFLIPTFQVHRHHLRETPDIVGAIRNELTKEEAKSGLRILERRTNHSYETGNQNNLVLIAANLFFALRGSTAFGLDNLMENWVIRIF